jgi:hypothetical protein
MTRPRRLSNKISGRSRQKVSLPRIVLDSAGMDHKVSSAWMSGDHKKMVKKNADVKTRQIENGKLQIVKITLLLDFPFTSA